MNAEKSRGRLLLHICCAPDATIPWPELIEEKYETTGYFYGGNIHPREEYDRRTDSLEKLAREYDTRYILEEYRPETWFEAVRGLEKEPERGARCVKCFETQLKSAAKYAKENGYTHLCTTLTISPHKDAKLINDIGAAEAERQGLIWVEKIWRKKDGFKRSVAKSRELGLYRQNYCGCTFSENPGEKKKEE
ncbi:MAG: epoxyqueuosine reductase QueH [Synergistes sp.]|nr:epoxyqueuosine reductase QueH [Synergistes sp.]